MIFRLTSYLSKQHINDIYFLIMFVLDSANEQTAESSWARFPVAISFCSKSDHASWLSEQ